MAEILPKNSQFFGKMDAEKRRRNIQEGRFLFTDDASKLEVVLEDADSPSKANVITTLSID